MRSIEHIYEREISFLKQNNSRLKEMTVRKHLVSPERVHSCQERTVRKAEPALENHEMEEFLVDLHRVLKSLESKVAMIKAEDAKR